MSTEPAPPAAIASLTETLGHYARLMRLHQPEGLWLLLWPALWALWLSAYGRPDAMIFLVIVTGVVVMRSAGCVINDYADRRFDPHVARTRHRPLAAGLVSKQEALALFVALALVAIALALMLNRLAQYLAIVGGALTVAYPFSKRWISAPQLVLGAAFGWSVPMTFAAQTGSVPPLAWLLWVVVIVWAFIYDTMYAMADRPDDRKAGVKSTAILLGSADVFIISLAMIVLILGLAFAGKMAERGPWYFAGLLVAGLLQVGQRRLLLDRDPAACLEAFRRSHLTGAAVFAGIVLDYTFQPL